MQKNKDFDMKRKMKLIGSEIKRQIRIESESCKMMPSNNRENSKSSFKGKINLTNLWLYQRNTILSISN